MKNYTITVNGNVYDVTVEENGSVATPAVAPRRAAAPAPAPVPAAAPAPAPAPAPAAAPAPTPAAPAPAPAASTGAGSIKIEAGAAGKIFKLEKKVGEQVSRGEAVLILEAMKMEIPVVAPEDGTVASINVAVGDMVEAGALLATLN